MGDQNRDASASGIITESLQAVKQSFTRLITELREVAQKGNNWPEVEPLLNRVDGTATNFFTQPDASQVSEVKRKVAEQFTDVRQVCERSNIAPAILPFVAGAEAMMNTLLHQRQHAQ